MAGGSGAEWSTGIGKQDGCTLDMTENLYGKQVEKLMSAR